VLIAPPMSRQYATETLSANAAGIARAAEILRGGGLVALPTETVYGLAGRADRAESVAAIYRAKGRPDFNPLIVHVPDVAAGERLAHFDKRARPLAERFWPGPLTLVLPLRSDSGIVSAVTAGLPTIALRCPAHSAMRAVLAALSLPVAAPSANRSGAVSPTTAAHVHASLDGRIDAVLDGGPCASGLESSIVALRPGGWQLLREGPVTEAELNALLGEPSAVRATAIEAPGQLAQHYSPGKPVRLGATDRDGDEFLIGFGPVHGDCTLSSAGDLDEAAARLYDCLHLAAASGRPKVAVARIPDEGIGRAINDRLRRAAA